MKTCDDPSKMKRLEEAETIGWRLHNKEKAHEPTAEESLIWLEGVRAFMFEVWGKNPSLRKIQEGFSKK